MIAQAEDVPNLKKLAEQLAHDIEVHGFKMEAGTKLFAERIYKETCELKQYTLEQLESLRDEIFPVKKFANFIAVKNFQSHPGLTGDLHH